MQKKLLLALPALLLTLCACSAQSTQLQQALDFRTALTAAGGCTFSLAVTVNEANSLYTFAMDCAYEAGGGVELTLTAPQSLAGIGAQIDSDGARVVYADTQVGFSSLAGGRLAPMQLPYLLASSWYEGYISAAGTEDGLVRVSCLSGYGADELTVDTWLSAETGQPEHCEISYEGVVLLSAEVQSFSLERGKYENTEKNMGGNISGQSGA